MANPTVTIEIKAIDRGAFAKLTKARIAAGRLAGVNRRLGRSTKRVGERFKKSGKTIGRFSDLMKDLETNAVLALGPLSGVGARIRAIGVLARRGNIALILFAVALTAVIGAAVLLVKALIDVRIALDPIEGRLRAVTGASILARRELERLIDISFDLGLDLKAVADGFSRLAAAARGTSLEGKAIRDIFTSITRAAAALRLSVDDTEGIIRAFEQALTKGVLRAEEFNQQLGDRLPGAAQLAAKAINKTKQEFQAMLVAGEIITEEFLPKLSEQLDELFSEEAQRNAKTLTGSMNQLKTAFSEFFDVIESKLGITRQIAELFNALAESIRNFTKSIETPLSKARRQLELFRESIVSFELGGILEADRQDLAKTFTDLREELKSQIDALAIEALRLDQEVRLKPLRGLESAGRFQGLIEISDIIEEIRGKRLIVDELTLALERLFSFAEKEKGVLAGPDITKITKAFDKLKADAISTRKILSATLGGDVLAAQFEASIRKADKVLVKFSDKVQEEFAVKMGTSVEELSRQFARLIQNAQDFKTLGKIFEETRTPVEKFITEMAKLERLLELYKGFPEVVEAIKRKMLEINPVMAIVSDSIKSFGNDLVSAIRKGESLVDVLINSFGNLIEKLLELAIQLLIIGPLLKALGLPGGSAAPSLLSLFGGFFGFAHGADFTVRGKGGTDTNLVPLALTAGERVQVTPAGGDSSEKMTVINFNFLPGTNVREFRESQGQLAATVAGVLSSASQSNS